MNRDRYRDQIVTCDVGVSLHSKTSTVHEVQQWHKHTVLCISLSDLVSCVFLKIIPICPFLIQRNSHLPVNVHLWQFRLGVSITLEPLYDVIVALVIFGLQSNVWLGHDNLYW